MAALVLAGIAGSWMVLDRGGDPALEAPEVAAAAPDSGDAARIAFDSRSNGRVIAVNGVVERILSDDRDGSPHQRFIMRSRGGVSLLVAHNLDLAPRLEGLAAGDAVEVLGEYEWNDKGGVMHWTHDDPRNRHQAGYIKWRGKRYQ